LHEGHRNFATIMISAGERTIEPKA